MRIAITGDVNRPGQHSNILSIYARINDLVRESFGEVPKLELGTPLKFEEWVAGFEDGPFPVDADLVIGFELPPCAKHGNWIDIRRHPLRFGADYESITSNLDLGIDEHAASVEAPQLTAAKLHGTGILTLQVDSDASLIREGRLIRPWHIAAHIRSWARHFDRVLVVPHPLQPESVWTMFAREELPNAEIVKPGAYPHLETAECMATVSSSTGIEAPFFNCKPLFFHKKPEASLPFNVDDRVIWESIARAYA